MKQTLIIAWPHKDVAVEAIREIIANDGYLVIEEYQGNKQMTWNPKGETYLLFVVGSNSHLLISNILGELEKHLCSRTKAIENEKEIKRIIEFNLGARRSASEK